MNATLDLNQLQIFKEVVQLGSFTKAANQLKQPKSRISRQIASLEQAIGMQLIYRTTRQFQLTQAGRDLFERIQLPLNDLKNGIEVVTSQSGEIAGLIKLTVPADLGAELLGKLCHEFMQLYPQIKIGLHASDAVVDLVKDSIDVAVRFSKARDSTMIQKRIGMVDSSIVVAPALYQQYQLKKLEDLEKIPHLSFRNLDLKAQSVKFTNGKDTKSLKLASSFSSNNFFVIRDMVLQGMGFGMIPNFLAKTAIDQGELVQLFKEWKTEGVPIQILVPHQKEMPRRIRKFIDFLSLKLLQYF